MLLNITKDFKEKDSLIKKDFDRLSKSSKEFSYYSFKFDSVVNKYAKKRK
jgi:hypothetical protein